MTDDGTTATIAAPDTLTVERLEALIVHEPIGEWMREMGFPPEHSLLIVPQSLRSEFGPGPFPRYVKFSRHVDAPLLTDVSTDGSVAP